MKRVAAGAHLAILLSFLSLWNAQTIKPPYNCFESESKDHIFKIAYKLWFFTPPSFIFSRNRSLLFASVLVVTILLFAYALPHLKMECPQIRSQWICHVCAEHHGVQFFIFSLSSEKRWILINCLSIRVFRCLVGHLSAVIRAVEVTNTNDATPC